MGVNGVSLANRRMILLAVLSLVASLLTVSLNAPAASALNEEIFFATASSSIAEDDVAGVITVPVTLTYDTALAGDVTATVTVGGTATDGVDFTASGTSIAFLAVDTPASGETRDVTITLGTDDSVYEGDETIILTLTAAVGATIVAETVHTVTITDAADTPVLTIDDPPVAEGTPTVTFTITRTGFTELSATADVDTGDGTATAPSDYGAIVGGSLSIPSGGLSNSTTIIVAIADDGVAEPVETFDLLITNPGNASGTPTGTATITDDDATPTLSINDQSVAEDGTSVTFTVTRNGETAQTVGASWTTNNGTAIAGSDYTGSSGTISIAPGGTSGTDTIVIPITNGAGTYELTEAFTVDLSAPSNATIADGSGLGTITDNDSAPTLAIDSPVAVAENGTSITFTVTRTGLTEVVAGASWATNDGTAVAATDYSGGSGSVSIAPGGATGSDTIIIPITNDGTYELTESFTVDLATPTNSSITTGTGTGTITDNDSAPTLAIDSPVAVAENGTSITFTVTRTGLTEVVAGASWATNDGTAVAATDYSGGSGSVSIAPGGATGSDTIIIPITDDSVNEATEAFTVALSAATDATITGAIGTGTITDDDPLPTISIDDVSVSEAGTMMFTITRNGATDQTVGATANSVDGTATAGTDFTVVTAQSISIAGGGTSNSTTLTVPLNNETTYEATEAFTVVLTDPTLATLLDDTGLGTITNDDAAPVLTIDSQSVAENVVGGTATFTVTRTGPTELAATALVNTANVTATAGTDYTALASVLVTIPAGLTPGTDTVDVLITNDLLDELATETFNVVLSGQTNSTLGVPSTGVGTIVDDDGAPALIIDDVTVSEGGTASFTVTKVGTTALDITVRATTSDLAAVAPGDYDFKQQTVTILAAASSATFTVDTNQDTIDEDDEDFRVTLDLPTNSTIGDATGDGTITDDDASPILTVTNVTVAESAATATFTVTRTGLTERTVTVTAQTADVTATAGADYVANIETLTIVPGGATGTDTLVVAISEDFRVENTETFNVDLSVPVNSTIGDGTGVGTITDNDTAGVTITQSDGSTDVIEGGATDTYTIVLTAQPDADVTVHIAPDVQVTVSTLNVTFTDTNWNVPQTITVAAVEDGTDEIDPHPGLIQHSTTSTDSNFNALAVADVIPSVGDADALLVTIDGPTVGAPGLASTFTAVVNAGGTGTITYDWQVFSSAGPLVATGDQATFEFTPSAGGGFFVQVIVGDSQGQNPAKFIQFRALGDVAGSIFVNDIVWLAEEGITKGCNPPANDEFCPNDIVTREQMAAFLSRFLDLNVIDPGAEFIDDDGSIFENDIERLATAGITRGCNPPVNDMFCPTDRVTREQMAAFLVRALGLTDTGGGNTFTDDNGSIFEDDIAKLATAGITRGCNPPDNTQFCPTDFVTRGQMAAFLRRADKILNP